MTFNRTEIYEGIRARLKAGDEVHLAWYIQDVTFLLEEIDRFRNMLNLATYKPELLPLKPKDDL